MAEPFIGEIKIVAFNYPPRGWAFCNGQLLAIAQNQALFSLLGTTYGGDGQTTFALPDLRDRVASSFSNVLRSLKGWNLCPPSGARNVSNSPLSALKLLTLVSGL